MQKQSATILMLLSVAASTGCTSAPIVQAPAECPPPATVAAWILEPEPSLVPKLDSLFQVSEKAPSDSMPSLQPAKQP